MTMKSEKQQVITDFLLEVTQAVSYQALAKAFQKIEIDFYGKSLKTSSLLETKTKKVIASIRPEAMNIVKQEDTSPEKINFKAKIVDTTYLGAGLRITVRAMDNVDFQIQIGHPKQITNFVSGSEVIVEFSPEDVTVFPDESVNNEN